MTNGMRRYRYTFVSHDGRHTEEGYFTESGIRSLALEHAGRLARHMQMKVVSLREVPFNPPVYEKD
jgi:hypothetical protein